MEGVSNRQDLTCPITLDIYRDPVIAGDGHIYERAAIIRWIEQQGTSPLTREPLDVSDLCSEKNMKHLCQSYRPNSVIYSRTNTTLSSSPTTQSRANIADQSSLSEGRTNRGMPCKQNCNIRRTLLIIMAISFISTPFIIATSVILFLVRSNSVATISTSTKHPNSHTYPSTIYKLPNNCTQSRIVTLISWNNVQPFSYTRYSTLYKAVASRTIITFAFRHDLSSWCLDDVSVIDGSSKTELIKNGNFEDNPSDGFFRCNSYGDLSATLLLTPSNPRNGNRSFCDDSVGLPDYLSQVLNMRVGQVYRVSFQLQNLGDAPNSAQVIMSY